MQKKKLLLHAHTSKINTPGRGSPSQTIWQNSQSLNDRPLPYVAVTNLKLFTLSWNLLSNGCSLITCSYTEYHHLKIAMTFFWILYQYNLKYWRKRIKPVESYFGIRVLSLRSASDPLVSLCTLGIRCLHGRYSEINVNLLSTLLSFILLLFI